MNIHNFLNYRMEKTAGRRIQDITSLKKQIRRYKKKQSKLPHSSHLAQALEDYGDRLGKLTKQHRDRTGSGINADINTARMPMANKMRKIRSDYLLKRKK